MRRSRRSRGALLLLLALAALATGCASAAEAGASAPDTLQVTRTSAFPENHIPALERSIHNAITVSALYAAVRALPSAPKGIVHCPADFGVQYHLTFLRDNTPLLQATADASGCRWLRLGSNDVRQTNDTFWSLLARTLGVPASALFPSPVN